MGIRKARPSDWVAIGRLLDQLEYPGWEGFLEKRVAQLVGDPNEHLLVWEEEGDLGAGDPQDREAVADGSGVGDSQDREALAGGSDVGDSQDKDAVAGGSGVGERGIAAFVSLHFIPQLALAGDFARLSYFAVDGEVRSKGIGRAMEEYCARLARERGCALMEVHCHTRRVKAHAFYYRQGFEESPKYLVKRL